MNLTYAIADLHGRFDLLQQALIAIEAHAPLGGGRRKIVFLGDYIDRGPESRKILDHLMRGPPQGWDWICLKGNHEDMMTKSVRGVDDVDHWLSNGGGATLNGFALEWRDIEPYEVPADYVAWIERRPSLHVETHRIFVHAGVDPARSLEAQDPEALLWMREQGPAGYHGKHVVHGHTPNRNGPQIFPGRTNLDTWAWKTGRLVVGVFDDDHAGGAVDFIEVRR